MRLYDAWAILILPNEWENARLGCGHGHVAGRLHRPRESLVAIGCGEECDGTSLANLRLRHDNLVDEIQHESEGSGYPREIEEEKLYVLPHQHSAYVKGSLRSESDDVKMARRRCVRVRENENASGSEILYTSRTVPHRLICDNDVDGDDPLVERENNSPYPENHVANGEGGGGGDDLHLLPTLVI